MRKFPIAITKTKFGVSPQARMTQIAWQSAFAEKRHLAKYVKPKLHKAAAYVRRTAKNSIKYRKDKTIKSRPGRPPFTHVKGTGGGSIKNILFGKNPGRAGLDKELSRIIGPVLVKTPYNHLSSYKVPEMLEFGGSGTGTRYVGKRQEYMKGKKVWVGGSFQRAPVRMSPRPTMKLALKASLNKVPEIFKGLFANVRN